MSVKIISNDDKILVLEMEIPLEATMLNGEETIQQELNEAGSLASGVLLERFDTDGSPLQVGSLKFTSKGLIEKTYQTPYGETRISRHVYQSPKGGATYCPLEGNARIINNATPKLAKIVSHKYSKLSVDEVKTDLQSNHGRSVSRGYIQKVSQAVGVLAQTKEEQWNYATPLLDKEVSTVAIGLDGTTIHLREQGYRETMVGTIALYDSDGERLHTTYIGAEPEYGKALFKQRLEREVKHVKQLYPNALFVGVADGAADNWTFLNIHTSLQVTDFWHATEYMSDAADAIFNTKKQQGKKKTWLEKRCHELKYIKGSIDKILLEIKEKVPKIRGKNRLEKIHKVITYFTNQKKRMNYYAFVERSLPIGSGVTEAACKMIVKQRLCQSGMKWNEKGVSIILSLRTLERSSRWELFWNKISQYGIAC